MVDIRQIRYFAAVAESLHFGRAAQRLNVTQPPLSRQVRALEKELGVQLLDRHSRKAKLTQAGAQFLQDSKAVLVALERACRNARLADEGALGDLTVGFMMHAAYGSVPRLTRRFLDKHPKVQLHLREAMPAAIVEGVLGGEFDAGICFGPGTLRGLASAAIYREPLCLAVPTGHRLCLQKIVSPRMLVDEPLICAPASTAPGLRTAIADYFARVNREPNIRLETQLQQTIVSLVAAGVGIALVPRSLEKLGMSDVQFRTIAAAPPVEQVLFWRKDNLNPVLPHFLAIADVGPGRGNAGAT